MPEVGLQQVVALLLDLDGDGLLGHGGLLGQVAGDGRGTRGHEDRAMARRTVDLIIYKPKIKSMSQSN